MYIDDQEAIMRAFADTLRQKWNINYDVLSNVTYGTIDKANYDAFEIEIMEIIKANEDRIECIFLDLDFTGKSQVSNNDYTGFLIGQAIRKTWPNMPIIISTRFSQNDIYRKGMIFDFDNICDSTQLIKMNHEQFAGIVKLATHKRSIILDGLGDTPISFLTKKNVYLKHCDIKIKKTPFIFVAMPFNETQVRKDVWELGIKVACKKLNYGAERVDKDKRSISIVDKIATLLFQSDIVIADLTGWNANVLYELGLAHAANKPCILITQQEKDKLEIPFDLRHINTITYSQDNLADLISELQEAIKDWKANSKGNTHP